MKAIVQARNAHGMYSARTENEILVVFSVVGPDSLKLNDEIELDLVDLLSTQKVVRVGDQQSIAISVKANDIHDLRLPVKHGGSRFPSPERMRGT